jgi:hypothetical protein
MFRKWLFLGMMILLGAVLVSLVLRGRNEEKRLAAATTEIVKTAKRTPTRSMAPTDLDIGDSKVEITAPGPNRKAGALTGARCDLVIRNLGQIAYHDVMLKLQWLGNNGRDLKFHTQLVPETIQPGQVLNIQDVRIEQIPAGTARCTLSILYANLGPAPER